MDCGTPGSFVLHSLSEFAQTHIHRVGDAIQPSSVTRFSSCPQSFPSSGCFSMSWLFALCGQSIGASASASVLPMNIEGWLNDFRTDWFDLLAIQGTLKSLLQHYSLKVSTLLCSIFMVQLSHLYTTTGKTTALTRQIFVGKVMPAF